MLDVCEESVLERQGPRLDIHNGAAPRIGEVHDVRFSAREAPVQDVEASPLRADPFTPWKFCCAHVESASTPIPYVPTY